MLIEGRRVKKISQGDTDFWLGWKKHSIIYQEETRNGIGWGWDGRRGRLSLTHLIFEVSITIG
jgi:hypothetical protein